MKNSVSHPSFDIYERVYVFVLAVLKFIRTVPHNEVNRVLIQQLIRAVTSIGANLNEASGGESKSDFIHKISVAKKEARETLYWLELLQDHNNLQSEEIRKIIQECSEIVKILSKILLNTQKFRQLK